MPMATLIESSYFSCFLKLYSKLNHFVSVLHRQYFTMNKLNQTQMCLIKYTRIVLVLNENVNWYLCSIIVYKEPRPF